MPTESPIKSDANAADHGSPTTIVAVTVVTRPRCNAVAK